MAGEEVVGTYSLAVLLLLQPTLLVSKMPSSALHPTQASFFVEEEQVAYFLAYL